MCTGIAHTIFRAATDSLPFSALVDSAVSTATKATEPRAQTDAPQSSSTSKSTHFTCTEISASDDSTNKDAVDVAAFPAVTVFSEDTRQHVLGLLDEGYPVSDMAEIIGCWARSMRRWSRHSRDNGTVWCDPRLRILHGDTAIRNTHLTRAILTLVESKPAAFLRDHVDLLVALSVEHPTSDHKYVSPAKVYSVLRNHDYTHKRIESLYLESCVQAQRAFAVLIDEILLRCLVFCDEAHTAGSDLLLLDGRTRQNISCVLRDRDTLQIKWTSTMMAVTLTHGVLLSQTVVVGSAQTSDDWWVLLQCLHARMNTSIPGLAWEMQPDACVVVYDNARIQDYWGDEYMQANGLHYVLLPPYSSNLQPIEGVFAELKKHARALVSEDGRYMDKPFNGGCSGHGHHLSCGGEVLECVPPDLAAAGGCRPYLIIFDSCSLLFLHFSCSSFLVVCACVLGGSQQHVSISGDRTVHLHHLVLSRRRTLCSRRHPCPNRLAHRPKPCPNPRDLAGTAAPEASPPTDRPVQRETDAVDQRSTARLYLRKQRQQAPQGRPCIASNPSSPPDPHLPPPRRPYPRLRLARRRSCLPRLPHSRPVVAPRGPRALHLRRARGATRAPGVPRRPAASTRRPWRHWRMRE